MRKLKQLGELMSDLRLPGSVVEIVDGALQRDIWEVRKAGLNIMMSMRGDGKPVSFIEDCAVPLEHLAEYTDRLTQVFEKHGTQGHVVRPRVGGLPARAPGAEHEDRWRPARCVRSPRRPASWCASSRAPSPASMATGWCAPSGSSRCSGERLTRALGEVKRLFDPQGSDEPRQDRAADEDGRPQSVPLRARATRRSMSTTALDWSEWGGFAGAVEMCNNNGHCRKFDAGTMCPSYRVTGDEQDLTRGRANTLRLALTGQLGPGALTSEAMYETIVAVRELQGLQARMSDRRGHGADEDGVLAPLHAPARADCAPEAHRLVAALCAVGVTLRAGDESARCAARRRGAVGKVAGTLREASSAEMARGYVPAEAPSRPTEDAEGAQAKSYCSPIRSTTTSSPRTCVPLCGCSKRLGYHGPRRLSARRRPPAVLRPHLPVGGPGRRGARRRRGA